MGEGRVGANAGLDATSTTTPETALLSALAHGANDLAYAVDPEVLHQLLAAAPWSASLRDRSARPWKPGVPS
jgi:hypothetical protein